MPSEAMQVELLVRAHELSREALALASLPLAADIQKLLRAMNSYYTNRIEGQHTRPRELEEALRKNFSNDSKLAARQRLAIAHMDAELEVEARYAGPQGVVALFSADAVQTLHRSLFAKLHREDLQTPEGEPIEPGAFRTKEVSVGQHVAPASTSIPEFMERWASVYGGVRLGEATLLAVAASHQRLGWIHPFIDGNGRVMRLHTHALLNALGYTGGVWSPLRGFARTTDKYYALLAAADEARRGDLDGRGNLSERALIDWIDYVFDTCLDQIRFMKSMLNFGAMEERISACLLFEQETAKSGVRFEVLRPLHYLFLSGAAIERGEFKRMTGLGACRT